MARNTPPGPGHGQAVSEVAREGEDAELTGPAAAVFELCLAQVNNSALANPALNNPALAPVVPPNVQGNPGGVDDDDRGRGHGRGRGRGGSHDNSGPGRGHGRGR